MAWWREARFGMFVHWGLYSGLAGTWEGKAVGTSGGMEWIQRQVKADTDTYAKEAIPLFKPSSGFARRWAELAKEAGCRYVVFTTKHHDGFALHDSQVSDYDAGSVLNRDLVREIVDALRAEGLRVGFYHSVIDWHHDQYAYARSEQLPHPLAGKPYLNRDRDHTQYVDYLHEQMNELASNYGDIDIVWWDYSSQDFQGDEAWRAFALMDVVRNQHPGVIMNNRLFRIPEAGWTSMGTSGFILQLDPRYGDFITPEQHIPATGMPGLDWETCMTMNTTWGYSDHDHAWKSNETLIRNLVDIASKGGNYLLNIGPRADGSVPVQSVKAMQAIGAWMKVNSEAIYGTDASPFKTLPWGRCTQKQLTGHKTRLYLHVFDWPTDGKLASGALDNKVLKAFLLADEKNAALDVQRKGNDVIISVPSQAPDAIASVVVLDIKGRPVVIEPPEIDADGNVFVDAMSVQLKSDVPNSQIRYTLDGSEPLASSPVYGRPIRIEKSATLKARLFRDSRAVSGLSERSFKKVIPRRAEKVESLKAGLAYAYYEGNWDRLPDFDRLEPQATGSVETLDLSLARRNDRFGFRFDGYVEVPSAGLYQFYLRSDDGSKLYIGNQCVIDHDGLHASNEKSGKIALSEGLHPMTVIFFEQSGGQGLEISYSGPGLEKQVIPASALWHQSENKPACETKAQRDERMAWY